MTGVAGAIELCPVFSEFFNCIGGAGYLNVESVGVSLLCSGGP